MKNRSWFNFLNPKIVDEKDKLSEKNLYDFILKNEYKKRQEYNFLMVFFGYMVYYFTRKQWSVFGSEMANQHIITDTQYALVGLCSSVAYGISKFVTSPLSDIKSNRWLFGLGLSITGVVNILLGVVWLDKFASSITTTIVLSCIFLIIKGFIDSFGANPALRLIYNFFNHKSRRYRVIVWDIAHNIGGALAAFIITGSFTIFGGQFGRLAYFIIPSVISIVFGIVIILVARDRPEELGLPSVQEYYNLELIGSKKGEVDDKPYSYYVKEYIIKNHYIWLLVIANLCNYILRMGIGDWSFRFFKEVHDFDIKKEAKYLYSLFEIGAVVLTLSIGLPVNKYFKKFVPIIVLCLLLGTGSIVGLWLAPKGAVGQIGLFIFLAGVVYVPQCFFKLLAVELSHHRVVGTVSGILGIAGYAGDALFSKVVIGIGIKPYLGFNGIFPFFIAAGILAILVILPMWNKKASQ
ncbi:Glycerol-3-phosphate transporter [Mycoplasma yeatsii 13926]|uniref:Glycerol-3-phosphate transporter n=1 Tax=Mycoplasma yeatsii 13926 TaxID=1188240 RepID=S6G8J1_9MOLU|nr:MFS transporter [Mycoplasma yeatsii]EOA07090.1 Glycerol-3-phosphate transporter [Mycoplasma yeatsii 13926]